MRTLVIIAALAIFGSTAAIAGEGNHFVKGTKSYQKSSSSAGEESQDYGSDDQASASVTNPQDISPAAGAEEEAQPTTKEVMVESMKLPRK
ncbi:MAG: hypothetical protein LRZ85_08780 [Alphaproteobacteria bacterium]|nr:hypothetical protein [Alphaproteobacteria bacterium]MCD8570166.1 hypothetical protein [Alphaproteobacteria bacterium]